MDWLLSLRNRSKIRRKCISYYRGSFYPDIVYHSMPRVVISVRLILGDF